MAAIRNGDRVRIKGGNIIYLVYCIRGQRVTLKMFGINEYIEVNLWEIVKV